MKQLFFPIAFLVFVMSCQLRPFQSDGYFEGKLTYSVTPEFKDNRGNPDSLSIKSFIKHNGEEGVHYLKNGSYRVETNNKSSRGIEYTLYRVGERKIYIKQKDKDTLFWSPTTKHKADTLFKILKDEKNGVLHNGRRMHLLKTQYDHMVPIKYGFDHERFTETYYYSNDVKINPDWYHDFERNHYNETSKIMRAYPHYYLREYISNTSVQAHVVTEVLIETKPMKLKDSLFENDSTLPLKKFPYH